MFFLLCTVREWYLSSKMAVFKYIFHHTDDYAICHDLAECLISRDISPTPVTTAFDLYCRIAEKNSLNELLSSIGLDFNLKDQTLLIEYKNDFSDRQWAKICLFEHHFCMYDEGHKITNTQNKSSKGVGVAE